jgi:formylglycine-generating enzyme required for sulfatase activity
MDNVAVVPALVVGLLANPLPALAAETQQGARPEMVTIVAPGQRVAFEMGSSAADLAGEPVFDHSDYYTDDEQPRHTVTITVPYAIGRFEVTNQQYCDVMNGPLEKGHVVLAEGKLKTATGLTLLGIADFHDDPLLGLQLGIEAADGRLRPRSGMADHPVHAVSWYGAVVFSNALSDEAGLEPAYDLTIWEWDRSKNGYRLPTEAEWEHAARGDKRTTYAWGNEISVLHTNYGPSHAVRPEGTISRPVGFFDGTEKEGQATRNNASPLGICDMTGNVWEWCWDWYGRRYFGVSPASDPAGPEKGDDRPPYHVNEPTRVWRGGGWLAPPGFARVGKRWSAAPDTAVSETGFRVARSLLEFESDGAKP